jgi:hypothetical protein
MIPSFTPTEYNDGNHLMLVTFLKFVSHSPTRVELKHVGRRYVWEIYICTHPVATFLVMIGFVIGIALHN